MYTVQYIIIIINLVSFGALDKGSYWGRCISFVQFESMYVFTRLVDNIFI